jgi:hypothetical protein
MAFLDVQTALGRLVRAPDGLDPLRALQLDESERASLERIAQSAGYRFTVGVQRSWCVGRAARAGYLTLSTFPAAVRSALLDEWVNSGGGTSSFFAAEADALLDFIANRLPDPSHELTLCRLEQATLRANDGAIDFRAPDPALIDNPRYLLRRGRRAGIAKFYGEPHYIMTALLQNQPLPPVSHQPELTMLFGPGLDRLCRPASQNELALWETLTAPLDSLSLVEEGHRREDIAALFITGVVEHAA